MGALRDLENAVSFFEKKVCHVHQFAVASHIAMGQHGPLVCMKIDRDPVQLQSLAVCQIDIFRVVS